MYLYYALGFLLLILAIGITLYLITPRSYESSETVANSYDEWTQDGILEFYWGEHIHLGHNGSPPRRKDFLQAKSDFVHEMVFQLLLRTDNKYIEKDIHEKLLLVIVYHIFLIQSFHILGSVFYRDFQQMVLTNFVLSCRV